SHGGILRSRGVTAVTRKNVQEIAGFSVPELNGAGSVDRRQQCPVGRKSQVCGSPVAAWKNEFRPVGAEFPNVDLLGSTSCRSDELVVGRDGDSGGRTGWKRPRPQLLLVGDVESVDLAVVGSHSSMPAVRANGGAPVIAWELRRGKCGGLA